MVRILTGIYTVEIYQRPVCFVEDILHLEIVMGSVGTSFSIIIKKIQTKKTTYRLFEKVQFINILLKILQVNSQSYDS